ncbi:CBS domain-containing protein [Ornithinibacillus halophilus]|uniref:CBS domain-containing protein n=1 Tax=Ornithinibacillus halophilus TaxID=930117 RepID=A0A1M5JBV7_9BACI|nr:CBS domain-containing protein [Ornithinibacillus halophilus]SHG37855.1 CBS domain-containing protein [Ornithinibacillus halophilus]
MEKIETIEERITKPRTVIPEFARNVQSFQISDPLSYVLEFINEQKYSQFPIYKGEVFEELLTTNGISNWLASNIEEDIISIRDAKIEDVLPFEEYKSSYKFISRDTNIFEAEELFKNNIDEGERFEALFITHSGKQTEKLLGIITSWDIIDIPKV